MGKLREHVSTATVLPASEARRPLDPPDKRGALFARLVFLDGPTLAAIIAVIG